METSDATGQEAAVLDDGPADGLRVRVAGRPRAIQVTYPCEVDAALGGVRAEALYIYRRDLRVEHEPLRYGFDTASP